MNILFIDSEFDESNLQPETRALYTAYLENQDKLSAFTTIAPLKRSNPKMYVDKCVRLAAAMKYIHFRKDRMKFIVATYEYGKKRYIGTFDDFDESVSCLKEYVSEKIRLQLDDAERLGSVTFGI